MQTTSLVAALEREHREIDARIDAFTAVRGAGDQERLRLSGAIRTLRRHIYVEEEFLFPPLAAAGIAPPLLVMLHEHAQIWASLDTLERDLALGVGTDEVQRLCHQLAIQLLHHNVKEERIVYPQVDDMLDAPAAAKLEAFLDTGQLPDGWVCTRARHDS